MYPGTKTNLHLPGTKANLYLLRYKSKFFKAFDLDREVVGSITAQYTIVGFLLNTSTLPGLGIVTKLVNN